MEDIFEKAILEVRETKNLSLPTRKKIWLSYGEVDHDEENLSPAIKEGLIKRTKLAIKCVKKVMDEWVKDRKDDKRPQLILKKVEEYLEEKIALEEIENIAKPFFDELMKLINNTQDSTIYFVGLAACYVSDILFNDEPLLFQDEYPDCLDEDLDSEMWDASYYTYWVYLSKDEEGHTESIKKKRKSFGYGMYEKHWN